MSLFTPIRRFDPATPEIMDRPNPDPVLLRDDLNNLRIINKFFGGLSAVRKFILPLIEQIDKGKKIQLLDLATGTADHPLELIRLVRVSGRTIQVIAVDKNPIMLQISRERTKNYPEITIEQHDILQLPYSDKSFDIVLCSLALHHFSHEDAINILLEMKRLSRVGFIVNDLNRTWIGACVAWLYVHMTTRNPITLYDSFVSVLRAFTPHELRDLAKAAGIQQFEIRKQPFFRLILVGTP